MAEAPDWQIKYTTTVTITEQTAAPGSGARVKAAHAPAPAAAAAALERKDVDDEDEVDEMDDAVDESAHHHGAVVRVNEYTIVKHLGVGTFARVKLVERGDARRQFALKVYSKTQLRGKKEFRKVDGVTRIFTALDKVYEEIKITRHLRHKNVALLFEVIDVESFDKLYLIMEYLAGGQCMLWDEDTHRFHYGPKGNKPMPAEVARKMTADLATGLAYLHSKGVVHRDIKPDNVLFNGDGDAVLADLGCAYEFAPEARGAGILSDTVGTYAFLAPEVCAGDDYNAYKVDVWALGVTLFACLTGKLPFWSDHGAKALFDAIRSADLDMPATVPPGAQDLLYSMLDRNPASRLTAQQVLEHPWIAASDAGHPVAQDGTVVADVEDGDFLPAAAAMPPSMPGGFYVPPAPAGAYDDEDDLEDTAEDAAFRGSEEYAARLARLMADEDDADCP